MTLNIAGSEWFIIFIVVIILIIPKKIGNISKTFGKVFGEYEKTKAKIINQKNLAISQTTSPIGVNHKYKGPMIQRPISSERQKLEIIAKSLDINPIDMVDDDLRTQIAAKLKKS